MTAQGDEEGWGPSTAVYSASLEGEQERADPRPRRPFYPSNESRPRPKTDGWAEAGPLPSRDQRAVRAAERNADRNAERNAERSPRPARAHAAPERGLPGWGALLVLIGIAGLGGLIDTIGSISGQGGFNVGVVAASIVAILIVRRSHMFPIVIAPPIVYSAAALFQLYIRSSGLHDKRVVLDAAANYLVYGFPAIAAATAAVLIIAGIRLISRK